MYVETVSRKMLKIESPLNTRNGRMKEKEIHQHFKTKTGKHFLVCVQQRLKCLIRLVQIMYSIILLSTFVCLQPNEQCDFDSHTRLSLSMPHRICFSTPKWIENVMVHWAVNVK